MSAAPSGVLRVGAAGAGLRGFLSWWWASLAACLPVRWRSLLAARRERLLLQVQGEDLRLRRESEAGVHDIASLPLPLMGGDGRDPLAGPLRDAGTELPRWLLLPAAQGLRRSLVMPGAARERLREVLAFEIERQTPFAAADVLYDGRVLQVREDGQLLVELVVVPKRAFDAQLAYLGGLSGWLAGADLADAEGRTLGVNLLPVPQRRRQHNPWRAWNLGFAVLAVFALSLALARVVDNRVAAADALQAAVDQRAAEARAVSSERQRLVDAVEGGAYLQQLRNGRPPAIEVLDALARRLPDGTYLERVSIEGGQLTVVGLSNEAAALVGKLEGAPQWKAPALSGALQPDPRTRMDRFTLVAQLASDIPQEATHGAR